MTGDMRGIAGVWVELHGRRVFKHRINNSGCVPTNAYGGNSTWYLMVERDGLTWLWDGDEQSIYRGNPHITNSGDRPANKEE